MNYSLKNFPPQTYFGDATKLF